MRNESDGDCIYQIENKPIIKKYDDAQSLLYASLGELQFANLQIEELYSAIDEIYSMTTDPLAKEVARMAKERNNLDKNIHSRLLFKD